MSSALLAIVRPSSSAPSPHQAPLQSNPSQAVTTMPYPREVIDFSQAGPVLDLVAQMHQLDVVKTIEILQPGYIPRAPHTPVGQKTEGIPDQRLEQYYPRNLARETYDFSAMKAPARLQSVPGYVVKQTTITRASPGYPKQALRAPKPRTGGGQCKDE